MNGFGIIKKLELLENRKETHMKKKILVAIFTFMVVGVTFSNFVPAESQSEPIELVGWDNDFHCNL